MGYHTAKSEVRRRLNTVSSGAPSSEELAEATRRFGCPGSLRLCEGQSLFHLGRFRGSATFERVGPIKPWLEHYTAPTLPTKRAYTFRVEGAFELRLGIPEPLDERTSSRPKKALDV